jgi:tetratricopeptide (TPR) repeat protein
MWGMAALNLGVVHLKAGEFDRARELFGESLALFAAAKNSERQLYALYNLAHLDRDRHEFESAAELYDVASSLAQRIGHSDVEIGAMAGAGLSLMAQGKSDPARRAYETAFERMRTRTDWFQGRELVVALHVHLLALDGKMNDAFARFEEALALIDANDSYSAAWLTSACAEVLLPHAPDAVRGWVERYSSHVQGMGYSEMNRKFEEILTRS